MREWKDIKLKECISTLKGYAFKSAWYQEEGTPIVRVSDFTNNSISANNIEYISNETAKDYQRYVLEFKDVIIQTVGSWQHNPASIVGKVVNVPDNLIGALLNQNAVKIIPKKNIDKSFLYYRLKDEHFKYYNLGCAQGAANQASITLSSIGNFGFKLPPLLTQKKIAKILSNYDDLIENNLKRIKLLEESARFTYEEWFVGRKIDNKLISDKDIEMLTLDEMLSSYMNGGWGKEEEMGNYTQEAYVIRGTDMPDISQGNFLTLPLRFHTASNLKPRKLNIGDIAIEMSNGNIENVGRSFYFDAGTQYILNKSVMCASFCKMIKPKNIEFSYIIDAHLKYIHATNKMLIYKSQGANGINNFRFENMVNEEILNIPKGNLLDALVGRFEVIYAEISNLRIQIKLLKEARDILLPRLMTGTIDVEDLEVSV